MLVTIDGKQHLALISCHHDGTFSYHDGSARVRKAKTVPQHILNDPELPDSERQRVQMAMVSR